MNLAGVIKGLAAAALLMLVVALVLRAGGGPPAAHPIAGVPSADESGSRAARAAFPAFDLAALYGTGRVRITDHAGKVVVVNVWASWCAPCREEMPVLDRLAATLDPAEVVVIGLNEDSDTEAARRFVNSLGGVRYPLAQGGGRLRGPIGYRGLPYTAVLDRSHRVVKVVHGFGKDLDDIRLAVEATLAEYAEQEP